MSFISRINALEEKLSLGKEKVYFVGWANCTWSQSEGLFRQVDESKEDFCIRVYRASKKQFIWFM